MVNDATTKELINELANRKGASEIEVKEEEQFTVITSNVTLKGKGRIKILIISLEDTLNASINNNGNSWGN